MTIIIGVVELIIIAVFIYNKIKKSSIENAEIENKKEKNYYKKTFMTECELSFYRKIKELEIENFKIVPQINLATIIEKDKKEFNGELFRNIDFAIFDKDYQNILLLIELNDSSHKKRGRKKRDIKVKKICDNANIKLITFYTNFANEKEYVINRIKKEILIEETKK